MSKSLKKAKSLHYNSARAFFEKGRSKTGRISFKAF